MKKSNVILGIILSLAILVSLPLTVFAGDPPPCPQGDWSIVDISVTNQWITNQAGTPDAAPWAKDATDVTITVQNNGADELNLMPLLSITNPEGKVHSDGLDANLDVVITELTTGNKVVLRGNLQDFEYSLQAGDEEGMVDLVARYDGKEYIVLTFLDWSWRQGFHYHSIGDWTSWEEFAGSFNDVFGVDNTAPTYIINVVGHASSGLEYGGAHYWQTASIEAIDMLSGVLSIVETKSPDGKTITWVIVDNAGNLTRKSVVLKESWAFASIALCEHCWHSFANGVGDMSGTGVFSVFAPGGWIFYKCPYCGHDTEPIMRANYKLFVERGGYVPIGDFYKGPNYNP